MGTVHRVHIDRSLDLLDSWMMDQRVRVERTLQQSYWRVQATKNDGMTSEDIRVHTTLEVRR